MLESTTVRKKIAEHGLRCTKQRDAIYSMLASKLDHPTADDIYQAMSNNGYNASLATIYNTLEAFCQAGLVQKLPGMGENGSARYDATTSEHLHLRCKDTGAVADVPHHIGKLILDNICPKDLAKMESHLGFKISHMQIELIGQYGQE